MIKSWEKKKRQATSLLARPSLLVALLHAVPSLCCQSLCRLLHNWLKLCIRYYTYYAKLYITSKSNQPATLCPTFICHPAKILPSLGSLQARSMQPPPPFPPPSRTCYPTFWWSRKMSTSWRTSRWRWPAAPPRPHRSTSSATASGFTRTTTWSSGLSTRQQVPTPAVMSSVLISAVTLVTPHMHECLRAAPRWLLSSAGLLARHQVHLSWQSHNKHIGFSLRNLPHHLGDLFVAATVQFSSISFTILCDSVIQQWLTHSLHPFFIWLMNKSCLLFFLMERRRQTRTHTRQCVSSHHRRK